MYTSQICTPISTADRYLLIFLLRGYLKFLTVYALQSALWLSRILQWSDVPCNNRWQSLKQTFAAKPSSFTTVTPWQKWHRMIGHRTSRCSHSLVSDCVLFDYKATQHILAICEESFAAAWKAYSNLGQYLMAASFLGMPLERVKKSAPISRPPP